MTSWHETFKLPQRLLFNIPFRSSRLRFRTRICKVDYKQLRVVIQVISGISIILRNPKFSPTEHIKHTRFDSNTFGLLICLFCKRIQKPSSKLVKSNHSKFYYPPNDYRLWSYHMPRNIQFQSWSRCDLLHAPPRDVFGKQLASAQSNGWTQIINSSHWT